MKKEKPRTNPDLIRDDWKMSKNFKENTIRLLIRMIGDDMSRPGLKDTPARVVKMYEELFKGNFTDPPTITVFKNGDDGIKYDQMIVDKGYFFSQCEHHMVPFFGEYYFAYIPKKKVLGLSKVARVVDYFSARLQVQERLTKDIADYIQKSVKPHGIAVVMKARHLCKEMRGVKKYDSFMVTSDIRGDLKKEPEARAEFLRFINL